MHGGFQARSEGFSLSSVDCSHLGCIVRDTEPGGGGGGAGCWGRWRVRPLTDSNAANTARRPPGRFCLPASPPLCSRDRLDPPLPGTSQLQSWPLPESPPPPAGCPSRMPPWYPHAPPPGLVQEAGVDAARPGNCTGPAYGLGLPKRSRQGPQGEGGHGRGDRCRVRRPQAPVTGGPSPAHPCPSHLDSGFWRPEPGHTLSGVVSAWRMVPGMAATGHRTKLTRTKTCHRSPQGWPCQRLARRTGRLNLLPLQPSPRVPPEPTSFPRPRGVTLLGTGAAAGVISCNALILGRGGPFP